MIKTENNILLLGFHALNKSLLLLLMMNDTYDLARSQNEKEAGYSIPQFPIFAPDRLPF